MDTFEHHSYLQLCLLLGDREDVRVFANDLVKSINPDFLKKHASGAAPETIVVALLGSFNSLKSALADDIADAALPRKDGEHHLSGYGAKVSEVLPYRRRGESPLTQGSEIELTFSDPSNEKFCEDRTLPAGIDFQQNVLPHELKDLWLSIHMQEAPPSHERERKFDAIMSARAVVAGTATLEQERDFHDLEDKVDISAAQETLDRFDYADDDALIASGLKDAFDRAHEAPDKSARFVTLNIYKEALLNDSAFAAFIDRAQRSAHFSRTTGQIAVPVFFPNN